MYYFAYFDATINLVK